MPDGDPTAIVDAVISDTADQSPALQKKKKKANKESRMSLSDFYRVAHAFAGTADDELAVAVGDVVRVKQRADNGWWRAQHVDTRAVGWLPASHVKPAPEDAAVAARAALVPRKPRRTSAPTPSAVTDAATPALASAATPLAMSDSPRSGSGRAKQAFRRLSMHFVRTPSESASDRDEQSGGSSNGGSQRNSNRLSLQMSSLRKLRSSDPPAPASTDAGKKQSRLSIVRAGRRPAVRAC